jgi:hypothetical protein
MKGSELRDAEAAASRFRFTIRIPKTLLKRWWRRLRRVMRSLN